MDTILIQNKDIQLTNDFNMMEFWKPIITPLCQDFELYACIPQALQIFRNYYKAPWWVNSCWRPNDNPAGPTAHLLCPPAVDSQSAQDWPTIMSMIEEEMINWRTSTLIQNVLATGLNCIIIENVCLHMHYRTEYNNHPDDSRWPDGIYLGKWTPQARYPDGINITYSN